jgi:hypothetical protein
MGLQTYTFTQLQAIATHAVGKPGGLAAGNGADLVVNAAIQDLCLRHDWKWLQRPLSLDVTAATISAMTRASNVVTVTATHSFVAGDNVRITGSVAATNSFNGVFTVASVTGTTAFTFAQSGANESASTPGSAIPGFLALPADFARMHSVALRGILASTYQLSIEEITNLRARSIPLASNLLSYWAIQQVPQASASAYPLKRVELYPAPTAAATSYFSGSYVRALPILASGSNVPDIPVEFLELVAAAVRRQAVLSEWGRLDDRANDFEEKLAAAIQLDGAVQQNLGSGIPDRLPMPLPFAGFPVRLVS